MNRIALVAALTTLWAFPAMPARAQSPPNRSFEQDDGQGRPQGWRPIGSGTQTWAQDVARSGKRSLAVSDAGAGPFSGWAAELPARPDCAYSFSGWIKGGSLAPYGPVAGGALCIQFLDKEGQPLGNPVISEAVTAGANWTKVRTRKARPQAGAATVRLIVGLQFCKGTAWFDDVTLVTDEEVAQQVAMVRRDNPRPSAGVRFAENLLANGDVEQGDADKPKGWTYVGRPDLDWSPAAIEAFHREGRPRFDVGRGQGQWSRDVVYAGKGALLNASIDPPLSKKLQWYGRSPVDGYWLSDSMPCEPGRAYLAGAWIRPGREIESAWYGPLEILFFNARGGRLGPRNGTVRPGIGMAPAGVWTWWATLPYVAPEGAKTMRLRFGQELAAGSGGWGKTYADNLAVWALPQGADVEKAQENALQTARYWEWFRRAHTALKPPYLPSPAEAPEYESCLGRVINTVPGNLFRDPNMPTAVKVAVSSLLGETRKVALQIERYDWQGEADPPIEVPPFEVQGYSEATVTVTLAPTKSYGAFYLESKFKEGEATVGEFSGRYAVLPPLHRPRTAENIWGVTLLSPLVCDGRPLETELGEMLKTAGFGLAWINPAHGDPTYEKTRREVQWYQALGIRTVLRINYFPVSRPIDRARYESLGKQVATALHGKVAAYGNWGVEQSNHRTPAQPAFRPILGGQMLTDEEYDTILAAIYDGIKSVDRQTPVLIGNIATDAAADTVRRLYGKPAEGRFDGAILNAYANVLGTARAHLQEFDRHGDTGKTVWQEETADQRSPLVGPARRRGEAEGPRNMVRLWLSMKALVGPRLKAMTLWGFMVASQDADITMVTRDLQPRPHFVAHAVMADAVADATFVADRSRDNVTVFEWKRGDGPMFTLWANTGRRSVTLDAPAGRLIVMDLMGNRTNVKVAGGTVSLEVTPSPVYVFGP